MYAEIGRYLGQGGVWLKNDEVTLFVQKFGGMTPEFSIQLNDGLSSRRVNTHWLPHFKSPFSGKLDHQSQEQVDYWSVELLRQAAGTFCCAPAFGGGNQEIPTHGDTANQDWQLTSAICIDDGTSEYSLAQWQLKGGYKGLEYCKTDYLRSDDNSHYMVLEVTNRCAESIPINLAWHTTLGAPFLERGCRILDNCSEYQVAPLGTEFDETTQLIPGSQFSRLNQAPSSRNHRIDCSTMMGYSGHADFITATTTSARHMWAACYNPFIQLVYISVIPFNQLANQVSPSFMNYWIHAGGRGAQPWADYTGGCDRNYALGMECSIGGSCKGYDWSLENPTVLGKPTMHHLPAFSSAAFLCINSLMKLPAEVAISLTETELTLLIESHIETLDLSFQGLKACRQA
ncbi:hypothetical protein ACVXSW_003477 [Vibrio parahaemolyticus]|uniref:hypothetical protein n=1 Tax=Vibrio fluvialis TaxID=676 RepID=UPI001597E5E8|nr:hypothetical protein [Vibrio fluvialis]EGR3030511.1 hypothetical protein [Vibrio parahaemolyticus]EJR0962174.1 hypothetical protein [Vibrio parahaemolyticus]QKE35848.1 hypothetical protein HPK20_15135 [Vibrio fluvialis]